MLLYNDEKKIIVTIYLDNLFASYDRLWAMLGTIEHGENLHCGPD